MARPPRLSNILKEPIVFFCKDCEKIVKAYAIGRKFVYKCSICSTKNVAFGTEKALRGFYRVKEDAPDTKTSEEVVKKEPKLSSPKDSQSKSSEKTESKNPAQKD